MQNSLLLFQPSRSPILMLLFNLLWLGHTISMKTCLVIQKCPSHHPAAEQTKWQ